MIDTKDPNEVKEPPAVQAGKSEPEEEASEGIRYKGTYKLRKPMNFEGTVYTELPYDFERLGARDVMMAKKISNNLRGTPQSESMMTDDLLQAVLFCLAARLPMEFLMAAKPVGASEDARGIGAADYAAMAMAAQSFFAEAAGSLVG